ncbi:acetylornithine transaminase [Virgibacillus halodenitrificans]|uniref:Acetylornithine aminotransferase n=1 Tax=Virgibacillus halodenitrificans TaxID=1482 RepID=A0ABR7VI94_VIRHA|nr:acetylornithine transaminase [Virgibacillus halodenitrificans]MBD1221653.1 acetylornithine transaminase [Virgibacillus halodenitrificans]MYL46896.1 acetylornithine transaminase [Virgibacillus halodenitrificans]
MSETVTEQASSALMNVYNRFPLTLVKGKGSYVWDDEGANYLDFTSGIATCNLGHIPDSVEEAVKEQLEQLWHCSNLYHIPAQKKLAEQLVKYSCLDQVFFCNSGAEANEAAIKLAKKYAKDKGWEDRTEIVTFTQSFHGRTGSTMAATAQEKIHQGFTPLTPGFRYLPYNNIEALKQVHNGKTTAVLLELIQGEGGVNPANIEWLTNLRDLCHEHDILFMVDEIQTGMGRTGELFAYEQFGVDPDVITLAKGLGSGFPVGALLAKKTVAESFQPGTHGSTFGGNPLAMAAGLATIETIMNNSILNEVENKSRWMAEQLATLKQQFSSIEEVKMSGLLIGVQMKEEAAPLVTAFREKGILVLLAGSHVLRILPPLTVSQEELTTFITVFKEILQAKGANQL